MKQTALLPLLLSLLLLPVSCHRAEAPQQSAGESSTAAVPAGDSERGQQLITQYGCTVCHTIPGISGGQGMLAPNLRGVARRPTISNGQVQNTPATLVKFIANPPSMNPQSSMPALGITPGEAADIAAYLRTLR